MRKRTSSKRRLHDGKVNQSEVLFFPHDWRTAYDSYISRYHSRLTTPKPLRIKDVLKQTLLLSAWFVVLTMFFLMQKQLLAHASTNSAQLSCIGTHRL